MSQRLRLSRTLLAAVSDCDKEASAVPDTAQSAVRGAVSEVADQATAAALALNQPGGVRAGGGLAAGRAGR